ncbi:hypothetical protein [Microvirga sp. G4-2]|uniref:hypothetical protein n=1 Tax=Microvirga sp. G4-2 TaxID=3434467 RepID=UPI0040442BEC
MSVITDLASRAGSAAQSLWEASGQLIQPSLRLGVIGFSVESWAHVRRKSGQLERFLTPKSVGVGEDD